MSLASLDTSFPRFTNETTEEKVSQIQDYLYILLENLRYTLNNLDEKNWNPSSLSKITDPVDARIKDLEGNVAELEITATGLTSRMTDAEGNITTLTQTASGLSLRVTSAEGDINSIEQTLTGVAFTSSLAAGTTVINGGCISTGTISAQRIGTGTLTIGNASTHGSIVLDTFSSLSSSSTGVLDIVSETIKCNCNYFSVDATNNGIDLITGYAISLDADAGIVVSCHGSASPSSSTPGYGINGAIYFKY